MTYAFSLGNGSDSRLFSHTGDIIHVLVHGGREIQTLMDAATSPSIRMYVISIYCATEPPPPPNKKGSSNSKDKDYGHHSAFRKGVPMDFFSLVFC